MPLALTGAAGPATLPDVQAAERWNDLCLSLHAKACLPRYVPPSRACESCHSLSLSCLAAVASSAAGKIVGLAGTAGPVARLEALSAAAAHARPHADARRVEAGGAAYAAHHGCDCTGWLVSTCSPQIPAINTIEC